MKVLLTGANGFVGSHILDSLHAHDIPATVLLRPSSNRIFLEPHLPDLDVRTGSIGESRTLDPALDGVTHVIHCAGATKALHASEFHQVNHTGTKNLVAAVNRRADQIQRFVHISSLAAGGPSKPDRPATESAPPQPVSEYGRSKLAGELEVRNNCKPAHVVLRPPAVYGPRDTAFLRLFRAIQGHLLPLFGGGRQPLSLVFVKDLAEATVACLTHPNATAKVYYVAASQFITTRALAEEIAGQLKTWTMPLSLPVFALWPFCCLQELISRVTRRPNVLSLQKYTELRAPGWVCDAGRLQQELGISCPTLLAEGITRTLQWYRERKWL